MLQIAVALIWKLALIAGMDFGQGTLLRYRRERNRSLSHRRLGLKPAGDAELIL
jgi:hypothetical protein